MQVILVYLEWFQRNSFLKCVLQPKIAKNSLKLPILGFQGRWRSSMLVPLKSSSAVLVMISSKSVSICNRFHARWANSGKITISGYGVIKLCCYFVKCIATETIAVFVCRYPWRCGRAMHFICVSFVYRLTLNSTSSTRATCLITSASSTCLLFANRALKSRCFSILH